MPRLAPAAIDAVLTAYDIRHPRIVVPQVSGKRGHPVLFPWATAARVAGLKEHEGVNAILRDSPVREVPLTEVGMLRDMDTPAEYRALRDAWNEESGSPGE